MRVERQRRRPLQLSGCVLHCVVYQSKIQWEFRLYFNLCLIHTINPNEKYNFDVEIDETLLNNIDMVMIFTKM